MGDAGAFVSDKTNASHRGAATVLFNEAQSRIIISVTATDAEKTIAILRERNVPFQQLGAVGGDTLSIRMDGQLLSWSIAELYDDWFNSIRNTIEHSQP